MPEGSRDPLIGLTLEDRYRLTERLGEGAMSVVYRAEQPGGPEVAVKVMQEALGDDPKLKQRFEREARALFALQHENMVQILDFGIVNGAPYYVMELLPGPTLDVFLEDGPLDPPTALDLAQQILTGLALAHREGVVHRDLKTENIAVVKEPGGRLRAKILDFGLVKFVDEERWGKGESLTSFGSVFGTPAYMSPEQVAGEPTDARSDVYSVGVILFELLTGVWPFMEEDRVEMFRAHMMREPPSLSEASEGRSFPEAIEAVVRKALEKGASRRFPDAGAMLDALRVAREAHPGAAAAEGPRRATWVFVGVAALLAIGIGFAAAVAVLSLVT